MTVKDYWRQDVRGVSGK